MVNPNRNSSLRIGVALLLVSAGTASAQQATPQSFTLEGSVRDGTTGAPVAFATLSLTKSENGSVAKSAAADAASHFLIENLQKGRYIIRARADGYVEPSLMYEPLAEALIGDRAAMASASVKLYREGILSGELADRETLKPLAGIRITAIGARFKRGHMTLAPRGHTVSDAEGRFTIPKLPPGQYLMEIAPDLSSENELLLTGPSKGIKPDERPLHYGRILWPAGADENNALLTHLSPGLNLSLGRIELRRAATFEIHAKVVASCPLGACANRLDAALRADHHNALQQ